MTKMESIMGVDTKGQDTDKLLSCLMNQVKLGIHGGEVRIELLLISKKSQEMTALY